MTGFEAWNHLAPALYRLGIEIIPGEPGGFITTPQFPDPGTGRSLGDNVGGAVDSLAASGVTEQQVAAVRGVIDAIAKATYYQTVPRYHYDTDSLKQTFRDW